MSLRIIINSGTKEIHLRASSISEKIKWVNALRNSQETSFNNSIELNNFTNSLLQRLKISLFIAKYS